MVQTVSKQYTATPAKVDKAVWIGLASLVGGVWLAGPTPFLRDMAVGSPRIFTLIGALLAFFLFAGAVQVFRRRAQAEPQPGQPARLVGTGVYGYSRNPVASAFLFPLLMLGLFSPLVAATAIMFFVGVMSRFVIAQQEEAMRVKFGMKYMAYAARVPRWLV